MKTLAATFAVLLIGILLSVAAFPIMALARGRPADVANGPLHSLNLVNEMNINTISTDLGTANFGAGLRDRGITLEPMTAATSDFGTGAGGLWASRAPSLG